MLEPIRIRDIGLVTVTQNKDALVLHVGPQNVSYPLTHWDGDEFLAYTAPSLPTIPSPVTFTMGADGKASQILISSLDTNGQGTLTRTPDAVSPAPGATAGDFAGLVDLPNGHKLYLECSGSGSPTVVLEAGLRIAVDIWSVRVDPGSTAPTVMPAIAKETAFCV